MSLSQAQWLRRRRRDSPAALAAVLSLLLPWPGARAQYLSLVQLSFGSNLSLALSSSSSPAGSSAGLPLSASVAYLAPPGGCVVTVQLVGGGGSGGLGAGGGGANFSVTFFSPGTPGSEFRALVGGGGTPIGTTAHTGSGGGEHGLSRSNRRDDGHLSRPHAHERGRVAHGLEELAVTRI